MLVYNLAMNIKEVIFEKAKNRLQTALEAADLPELTVNSVNYTTIARQAESSCIPIASCLKPFNAEDAHQLRIAVLGIGDSCYPSDSAEEVELYMALDSDLIQRYSDVNLGAIQSKYNSLRRLVSDISFKADSFGLGDFDIEKVEDIGSIYEEEISEEGAPEQ